MIPFQGSKTGGSPHVGRKFEGPHIGQNHMPTAALLHEAKLGEALLLTLFLHLSLTKLFALAMIPKFQPRTGLSYIISWCGGWNLRENHMSLIRSNRREIFFGKSHPHYTQRPFDTYMRPQMYLTDKHL